MEKLENFKAVSSKIKKHFHFQHFSYYFFWLSGILCLKISPPKPIAFIMNGFSRRRRHDYHDRPHCGCLSQEISSYPSANPEEISNLTRTSRIFIIR